jgi:hypothetical protein
MGHSDETAHEALDPTGTRCASGRFASSQLCGVLCPAKVSHKFESLILRATTALLEQTKRNAVHI